MTALHEQVHLIREVFAYAERFQGSTFVIKISNEIINHPCFPQHAQDLAILHKAGIRIVVVPGARTRIDQVLTRFGGDKHFEGGTRVSHPDSMDLIKMAAFDVAHRVMTALSGHRITAVMGNWVRARSRGVIDGVDFGRTGSVDQIRVKAVVRSLEQNHVPIFPCIGHSETGDPFNLSSDELAVAVAGALHAGKLFHLTAQPAMTDSEFILPDRVEVLEGGRIFRMTPEVVKSIIRLNPRHPNREVLESAVAACKSGVERSHILDGRQGGVLLQEVFSNLGVGSMVFADNYERVRPMESADVPSILEIIQPLIASGVMVKRAGDELERKMKDYWVYAIDGVVHGCIALHPLGGGNAEIAGFAVDPRYTQLGIGAKLLDRMLEKAAEDDFNRLIVLTTQTADWFLARGFGEGNIADLPEEKRREYNSKRNSRVLVKVLE